MDFERSSASGAEVEERAERILRRLASEEVFSLDEELGELDVRGRFEVLRSLSFAFRAEGERFEFVRPLGMAETSGRFLARDRVCDRDVVLEMLRDGVDSQTQKAALLRKAKLLAPRTHPSFPRVFDWIDHGRLPCLLLEYVRGRSLVELLKEKDPAASVSMLPALVGAVAELHAAGIVHRAIEPRNVRVRPDGWPTLLGFELAGRRDDPDDPKRDRVSDSAPEYLAHEQLSTKQLGCDPRTDVFQLGALAFEIATGHRFRALCDPATLGSPPISPRAVACALRATDLDAHQQRLVRACLASNPANRPANAGEMLEQWSGAPSSTACSPAHVPGSVPLWRRGLWSLAVASVAFSFAAFC